MKKRQLKQLCSLLIPCLLFSFQNVNAKDIKIPSSVPEWFPSETCMEMMDTLIDEFNLSEEGAASVLGNVCQESKFDQNAYSGYYFGICQWDPYQRWPLIVGWIEENGYSKDDAIAQLRAAFNNAEDYVYAETLEYMKTVSSIEDGVHRWLVYYEGAVGQEESQRITYAYYALDLYNENK